MVKLEVSGESAEEFAKNAMAAFGLLAIGLQEAVQRTAASQPAAPEPPKPAMVADRADDLFVPEQEAPSAKNSSRGTPKEGNGAKAKAPKLDDLKARLADVITEAAARWDMKRANAYARKLLKEFGVEKASELKPEQYAEFMELSADYAAGNIAE